jgi:6-phosphogluconolactonase (cycloisomerase 2 family)
MNQRMSKRWWLLGLGGLILLGLLLACGSNFNASQDGLLLVGSQGSGLIETFSFTLSNGHVSAIANSPTDTSGKSCVLNGQPTSIVMDPAGAYAYAILMGAPCNSTSTGIAAFKVGADGNLSQAGNLVGDTNPVALSMDAAGKFLFVAEGNQGLVHSYSIGSGGTLTAQTGTYNFVNGPSFQTPNIVAIASSPTVFPGTGINGTQNSVCQTPGSNPPTSQFLYAVDSVNYGVWQFAVDTSTGELGNPPNQTSVHFFPTDQVPLGVAVDPCDRFVYVSDSLTNKVSGYTLCSVVQGTCTVADGSLVPMAGSPFSLTGSANGPGPIAVDPYGNNVYVVGTLSNTVSPFKITPVSGTLTALNPATVATGSGPVSIVIRGDDNWMFVANHGSGTLGGSTVSQYSITPATGALNAEAPIQTDNYPFGVAVK